MQSIAQLIAAPDSRLSGNLIVEYHDGLLWTIAEIASYRIAKGPFAGHVSTLRKGFLLDFASTPRAGWRIFPPAGDGRNFYGFAAAWHDWLYAHRRVNGVPCSRDEADAIFLEIMLYVGVRKRVALLMYRAVRAFGWIPWKRRREEDIVP